MLHYSTFLPVCHQPAALSGIFSVKNPGIDVPFLDRGLLLWYNSAEIERSRPGVRFSAGRRAEWPPRARRADGRKLDWLTLL